MSYIDTITYYRVVHRLSDKYSVADIENFLPYERDIYIMLLEEDQRRQEEAAQGKDKHYV